MFSEGKRMKHLKCPCYAKSTLWLFWCIYIMVHICIYCSCKDVHHILKYVRSAHSKPAWLLSMTVYRHIWGIWGFLSPKSLRRLWNQISNTAAGSGVVALIAGVGTGSGTEEESEALAETEAGPAVEESTGSGSGGGGAAVPARTGASSWGCGGCRSWDQGLNLDCSRRYR